MKDNVNATFRMKPKTIYKYYNISEISLLNLKKHIFYMSSPLLFNDPYDCAISTVLTELSTDDLIEIKNDFLESDKTDRFKDALRNLSNDAFRAILNDGMYKALNANKEHFSNTRGVCCFSEIKDGLLMWAHYSSGYKGFCLEFCTDTEPFTKLKQVKYVENMPKIDYGRFLTQNDGSFVDDLYCTKSKIWEKEKEWRILHNVAGTTYGYKSECLKAIYFGPKMDEQYREILCVIIQEQSPHVKFFQGELSKDEFKIIFKEFGFISYIKAKGLGLKQ